jgi:hypothetical protein
LLLLTSAPALAQGSLGLTPLQGVDGFKDDVGRRLTFVCPGSNGANANVYGTDVYTANSAVCAAAIHAGVLEAERAGIVTIVMGSGADAFEATERNGVRTREYGRWDRSYEFVQDDAPGTIGWRTVWSQVPLDFNEPIRVECVAGGEPDGSVWGTDVYAKDSAICVAAVHAGAITAEKGGIVEVARAPAPKEYEASERNGVASLRWSSSPDGFTVRAVNAAPAELALAERSPELAVAPDRAVTAVGVLPELVRAGAPPVPPAGAPPASAPPSTPPPTAPPSAPPAPTLAPRTVQVAGFTVMGRTFANVAAAAPRTVPVAGFTVSGRPATTTSNAVPRTVPTVGFTVVGSRTP